MNLDELLTLNLNYGWDGTLETQVLRKRVLQQHRAPTQITNVAARMQAVLADPFNFPQLGQFVMPGDQVVIVLDEGTPAAAVILVELWKTLSAIGVGAGDLSIVGSSWEARERTTDVSLRQMLPEEIRWHQHQPEAEDSCSYLASTAGGERIYLSRALVDADVVMTVGCVAFDPVMGIRGTASSLYPGLSDAQTLRQTRGAGHEELGPDEPRAWRQTIDEVGWLLGLQFSICAIPDAGRGVHGLYGGQAHSVLEQAREELKQTWQISASDRAELVLVTVPADASGHGWSQVAAAIDIGRRLVERNGRIVVLSQLDEPLSPGLEILRQAPTPRDALRPIQQSQSSDVRAALRIAQAVDWANVSLLSRLDAHLIDDLFLLPLGAEKEVQRLLDREDLLSIVEGGQHAFVVTSA